MRRRAYEGVPVGLYREGDDLLPIIARNVEEERQRASGELDVLQVQQPLAFDTVSLGQVARDIRLEWEGPIITRFNRRREVAIQASPVGVTLPTLRESVVEKFEEMEKELPPGFSMFWDGEYDTTHTAQLALIPGLVPAGVVMALIICPFKSPYQDGTTHIMMSPFEFMQRLAALVPRPRLNLSRFHGL